MAKKSAPGVGFKIQKIVTEQFAVIEENFVKDEKIKLSNSFRFGIDESKQIIIVFANFKFETGSAPFLIIEGGCFFNVEKESWKTFSTTDEKSLKIPKRLMAHLATLAVGTTRGILHAKTENTPFNKYFIPAINVAEMISEDIVFEV